MVTGEHSGLENPNMPAAMAGTGIRVFALGRLPPARHLHHLLGTNVAHAAPRYPSNIYYNAANWPDELNEYNTLYVAPGVSLGNTQYPTETGHCAARRRTTCLTTPATEATCWPRSRTSCWATCWPTTPGSATPTSPT